MRLLPAGDLAAGEAVVVNILIFVALVFGVGAGVVSVSCVTVEGAGDELDVAAGGINVRFCTSLGEEAAGGRAGETVEERVGEAATVEFGYVFGDLILVTAPVTAPVTGGFAAFKLGILDSIACFVSV